MNKFKLLVAGKFAYIDSTVEGFWSLFLSRLSYRSTGITFLALVFVFFQILFPRFSFAFSPNLPTTNLLSPIKLQTNSLFKERTFTKTQVLKFTQKTEVDLSLKPGETKIIQKGQSGEKVVQTKIVYHSGQEFSREVTLLGEKKPITEILAVAVNPSEQTLDTPYGLLKYNRKLTVWSTSYDSSCHGCNQMTSTGLKAGYGVIAVDPKVIPLRSKVYIPGYGIAVAGDTGGSVKGNKIDLGFDDLKNAWWSARYTDIYILS